MPIVPSENEEEWFAARNVEKRAELRKQAERAADRLKQRAYIGLALGSKDEDVLAAVEALGFTGNTARVLDLLPLIHVAWSDGAIQRGERAAILGIARQRGIDPEDEAFQFVASLLETRPAETFFDATLQLLKRILPDPSTATLVDLCLRVAEASGGLLGLGRTVSDAERDAIASVADALGGAAQKTFRARLRA